MAWILAHQRLGEHRGQEVAVDEPARVVNEETAVGVSVPGDPEIRSLPHHLGHDEFAVLRQQRVRPMVRELAIRLPVRLAELESEALEQRPTIGPAMPLPPSTTTFSGRIALGSMNLMTVSWKSS